LGLIRLQNITRQFGTQIVLSDVSLELHTGQIVGLVGANGAGKSTLFRIVAGEMKPDLGSVTRSKGLQVGHLPQEPDVMPGRTLHDEVASVFADLFALEEKLHRVSHDLAEAANAAAQAALMAEYDKLHAQFETAGGYAFERRLNEILGGLGFSQADLSLPIAALSGGQKCRAALAKLLLQDAQLLLLDEPTNHLDIDAVRWLEKFLAGHHGGAVIVSHDRYLLDRVAERIVEVENRGVRSYPGNYSNYVKARHVRLLTQERQYEKDREFIDKERDFFARYHAAQRGKEAKGRITRLERRLDAGEFVTERPTQRRGVSFDFDPADSRPATVVEVEGLAKRYGEKQLFTDLMFQVQTGQRFGVTGPNGTGKSTLLKILLGRVKPDGGHARIDPRFDVGYYAQEPEDLGAGTNVLTEILAVRPGMSETRVRSLLGGFLFSGDDVFKPIEKLSGGEQSRVRLLKLILQSPNVLILDEPTNHLDIASREALEEALQSFPGTILAISHDRYFLDRIAQRLLVIRPEGWAVYNGNYSFYIEQIEQQRAAEQVAAKAAAKAEGGRRAGRRAAGGASKSTQPEGERRFRKLSTARLEELIIEHEERIAETQARFGDEAVYRNPDELARMHERLEALQAELAAIETAWNRRAEG
jgi:ATP-binding cassette subfamily F protein 3